MWALFKPKKTRILNRSNNLSLSRSIYPVILPISWLFLTFGTLAVERVDLVDTLAIIETWLAGAFVCVDVAEHTFIS